ncbi:MAG: AraC family transcriptional regulator [Desulfobacter sp.]|nr:MAG: AraC family transcriptional regulator [Desulfobacter sp.]
MGQRQTTSAVAILALFDLLRDHGLSVEQIEARTGIDRSGMDDPDTRIFMDQFLTLWQIAEEVTKDPAIGLHLRQDYGKNYMHFTIMIAKNSDTLLEAAKAWSDYAMLVNDTDRARIHEREDIFVCTYSCSSPEYENKWIPEHHFSYVIDCARKMSGLDFTPVAVWFKHKDPGYRDEYQKILGCPVHFGMDENLMMVKKEDMMRPVLSPDPYLKAILKKHADGIVAKYSEHPSMKQRVGALISKKLHTGRISVQMVSDAMNMDRSTLHRRLKKEGITFRTLLTQTRRDLAKQYLIQGLSASQTAYLIGFTEPSTFHHAFKRWYGQSPGEFRKNIHHTPKPCSQGLEAG